MEGINYFANHEIAPRILQGQPMFNVEVSDGINPPGDFYPATYLPVALSESRIGGDWFVLMPGKVVSYDSNKRLIPAGLAWDKKIYDAAYAATVGDADAKKAAGLAAATIKYTAKDADAGVIGADGVFVQADDKVVEGMANAGIKATVPIGYMRYSARRANGSDPNDPTTWYRHAYDSTGSRAYSRRYYIQVPIVEVNARIEQVKQGMTSHRIQLYADGAITVYKGGVLQGAMVQKATPNLLTQGATGADPTEFAVSGRTIFFNNLTPANYTVKYTPKADLPFACLKANNIGDITVDLERNSSAHGPSDYYGAAIGYDKDSNYCIYNPTDAGLVTGTNGAEQIGRILDIKAGSSQELALVRTYYRDFGLWNEAPGSATDGRNAILSIANAPKYIARIAVNFDQAW